MMVFYTASHTIPHVGIYELTNPDYKIKKDLPILNISGFLVLVSEKNIRRITTRDYFIVE